MAYCVAIFVESEVGEWRVIFPDLPGCEARGFTLDDATIAASTALSNYARQNGGRFPSPRDLTEVEKDEEWLSRNGVDFTRAIVTILPSAT
jgi:predicted RNase H-like HicB family nuclease